MPPPETAHRHQTALYWALAGVDGYNQPKVSAPVELLVRWETGRREALDPEGNKIGVEALVVVDREVLIGSAMWLGTLAEWYTGTGSGGQDDEVMQVVTYNQASDVKNRNVRREVGLNKFMDARPEIDP